VEPAALEGKPGKQRGWFAGVAGLSPVVLDLGKRNHVGSSTLREDGDGHLRREAASAAV
jgi:hypothetical protein